MRHRHLCHKDFGAKSGVWDGVGWGGAGILRRGQGGSYIYTLKGCVVRRPGEQWRDSGQCQCVNTETEMGVSRKDCFQGGPSAGIWELGPGEGPPHPRTPTPRSGKRLPVYRQQGQHWAPAVLLRVWGEGGCRAEGARGTSPPVKTLGADSLMRPCWTALRTCRLGPLLGELSASCATPLERALEAGPRDFTTHFPAPSQWQNQSRNPVGHPQCGW